MPHPRTLTDPIRLLALRDTPLSPDEVYAAVGDDAAGATALFVGTVRDHDGGKAVDALEYSAPPTPNGSCARWPRRSQPTTRCWRWPSCTGPACCGSARSR
ncbi:molybdopterin synthase catalytic subunit [Streptomyces sp. BvitLS-983]|nr:molybdopterin synthase catalytic subunit [Streptomyces sp. BvitLS-983]